MTTPLATAIKETFPQHGVYTDLYAAKYHTLPAVSSTYLRALLECPAMTKVPVVQNRPMFLSECLHCAVLEPGRWAKAAACWGTKAFPEQKGPGCIALRQEIQDKHPDLYLLTDKEKEEVDMWCNGVMAHPVAADLVKQSLMCEASYIWEMDGILCKARVDMVGENDRADIKAIKDASPAAWNYYVKDHRLDIQQAWYDAATIEGPLQRLNELASGADPQPFHFIVVEKVTAICAVHYIAKKSITAAAQRILELLELHKACTASNVWVGYESATAELRWADDMREGIADDED